MNSDLPTVVIIAGGENSRFKPFNGITHKGFIDFFGEPLVCKSLRSLESAGFTNVVLVVSQKDFDGNGLSGYLSSWPTSMQINFVLQPEAKGQGDALLLAKKFLSDSFILMAPYQYNAGPLAKLLWQKQNESHSDCVFLGKKITDNSNLYGVLDFDTNNRVVGVVEKPESNKAPSEYKICSIYLLNKAFVQCLSNENQHEYSLESAFTRFAKIGQIDWIETDQELPSLKYPWHLFGLQKNFFNQMKSYRDASAKISPTAVIDESKGPVWIGSNVIIGHAAEVVGPSYLSRDVLIGDYSFARQSSFEESVKIGANTEVARSLFLKGSTMHFGYIADSIVGIGAKIGAGLITANKRHDRQNVQIKVKSKKVDTGTNSFGALIGNKAKIGIRVSTMPGAVIDENAVVWPAEVVYPEK